MANYTKISLNDLVSKNNKKVTEFEFVVENLPKLGEKGPWIAGGSLLRTYMGISILNDIDVFFSTIEQYNEFYKSLKSHGHFNITSDFQDDNVHNLTLMFRGKYFKVQLISIELFDRATTLLDKFDLNICQIAYDGKHVYVADSTLKCIDDREIRLNCITYPQRIVSRCMKYGKLGFSLPQREIDKFFNVIKNDKTLLDNKNQKNMSESNKHQNGKGDSPRPFKKSVWDKNHDSIDWGHPKKTKKKKK